MKKIIFVSVASLVLSVVSYQLAFANLKAIGCSITLNSSGSFTQHGCSARGSDTFQVIAGRPIRLGGSVTAIACRVTHVANDITPGFYNEGYFVSSSKTSVSTFNVKLRNQRGSVAIQNGTRLFDVSFKNRVWDFANSELRCQLVR